MEQCLSEKNDLLRRANAELAKLKQIDRNESAQENEELNLECKLEKFRNEIKSELGDQFQMLASKLESKFEKLNVPARPTFSQQVMSWAARDAGRGQCAVTEPRPNKPSNAVVQRAKPKKFSVCVSSDERDCLDVSAVTNRVKLHCTHACYLTVCAHTIYNSEIVFNWSINNKSERGERDA